MTTAAGCTVHDGTRASLHCDQPTVERLDDKTLCAEHSALFPDRKPRKARPRPRCRGADDVWMLGGYQKVPCSRFAGTSGYCRHHAQP